MDRFERVAREAVAAAGARLREAWRESKTVEYKGAIDLVTEADREIEKLVVDRLRWEFPQHVIVAEEASSGRKLERPPGDSLAWYLDPLDGTTNFAHGYPQFAVSLALARGAEPLLGIVYDPTRDETFFARRGEGASLNGDPIHVSTVNDLDKALLATGFPYDRRERADFYLAFLGDFLRRAQGVRRLGSAALDLCALACGRFDGFWELKLKPWDTAAGALIVQEAGGKVSDFHGAPFDLYGEQILASNGRIHEAMANVLTARLREG
jgi:myo-inositol-1(or 4)-monophosphatase